MSFNEGIKFIQFRQEWRKNKGEFHEFLGFDFLEIRDHIKKISL